MHTPSNRVWIAAASAALTAIPMLTMLAPSASAAVSLPTEVFPHNIIVFPQRDFVSLSGYSGQAGQTATFVVSRNGVTIGTASGVLGAGDPSLEVNHPGGVCWDAPSTPDILPGDEVQVYVGDQAAGGTAEGVRTRNVTDQQAVEVGTDVIVHGNATDLVTGGRVPLADLEQRIVNPDLVPFVGKRDIRATDISYDLVDPATNPNGTNFTAAYHGLSQGARDAAVAGEARVLSWELVDAAGNRQGITIYEAGVTGGPGMGGCPAASSYSVTSSGPKNLNVSTNAGALGLSGVSFDALGVRVSLDDTDPATAPVLWPPADQPAATPTPGSGRQTWSVSIPASAHNTLSDGTLSLTPQGGVVLQLGSNWQLETSAAHRVYRDQPAVPDFLPTLFAQRDLCEQGSESCYQMNLTRKVGDDSLTLGAVQHKVGDTLRLYFSDDFFDRAESLYLVRGDKLPEMRLGFQHKISPKVTTKLDSSLASGGGGIFTASDGQSYENRVRYLVTSLDTQFLGSSTGVFIAFRKLEQRLDPAGDPAGRTSSETNFERLQLVVNQNLNFLLNLASDWAVQLNMELSRGFD
ncbi:MAG: hypothetical protein ABJA81_04380, partial [Nocardioidaceae bacterium]